MRQAVLLNTARTSGRSRRQEASAILKSLRNCKAPAAWIDRLAAELKPVELQPGTQYLMAIFEDLNATRTHIHIPTAMGVVTTPQHLSFTEIRSYCELMGERLTPWEVTCIKLMDTAFLSASADLNAKEEVS